MSVVAAMAALTIVVSAICGMECVPPHNAAPLIVGMKFRPPLLIELINIIDSAEEMDLHRPLRLARDTRGMNLDIHILCSFITRTERANIPKWTK